MNGVEDSELRQAPRPKKSLAQNFLVDETHRDRIIAAADLTPADTVLEIGSDLGAGDRPGPQRAHRLAQEAGPVIDSLCREERPGLCAYPNPACLARTIACVRLATCNLLKM